MRMVSASPSRLPDAFIGLIPIPGDIVSKADEGALHIAIQMPAVEGELRGCVHDFAIDVELQLVARGIADANRSRFTIARKIVEFAFYGSFIAVDVVHDAQLRLRQTSGLKQPVEKVFRLVPIVEFEQGADGEGRVAQPAVAVVPIETGSDAFGKRGGGRGNDGAGWNIVQQLESQSAAN